MPRRFLLLVLSAAMALSAMSSLGASGADVATLKRIASTVDDRAGVLTIESSDPVPYIASQPDPRSFVLELRDVVAAGFTDRFTPDPRNPIAAVQVESAHAEDGISVARVRLKLSQPMRPRVRSARNVITVEADRVPADAEPGGGAIGLVGPSAVIRDVKVERRATGTAVSLVGSGALTPVRVEQPTGKARRLVLTFANVTSAVSTSTKVEQGPIERVRIGLDPKTPMMTQVVFEMSRTAPYRVESSRDGQDLTVLFDEPVAAASQAAVQAAMANRAPQTVPASLLAAAQAPAVPAAPQGQPVPVPQGQPQPQPAPPPGQGANLPPPPPTTLGAAGPPRYTGNPVSLDFQGADLRAVLRTFSEISGLNVVIDPSIQGTVDVALRDVPWDQALDIILRANKLGYTLDGTIVRIAPLAVFKAEEDERKAYLDAQASAVPLETQTYALSYAKAADISTLLKASQVLSPRGNPTIDERTNTLIVSDVPARLPNIAALIRSLDTPQPQVEIEARIVQSNRDFGRALGVQWGLSGRAATALGNTLPLAFPNQGSITGRTGTTQGDSAADATNTVVNLGANAATSAIGLALGSINGALNLDLALSAAEHEGRVKILSTPKVTTQNNVAAEITQGTQIPIQTVANNTVTVTFKDAALTLKVTPQITVAGTVIMDVVLENAAADFGRSINGIPPINTQRATTRVLVSNGETTVIGGVYLTTETLRQDRTPGLFRLPLLGWLFKRDDLSDQSNELLIFITPRIQRL